MVSTELLRRYPFFAGFDDNMLRQLAMISNETEFDADEVLFQGGSHADFLYLLRTGVVELHYVVADERGMEKIQDHIVGMINPGDLFGISAVVEPFRYTSSAVATVPSRVIKIEGETLRALCASNLELKALVQERVAATAFKRLQDARVQLLAV
jgi:CRP/FNR family transcriptional regulator, cyclic AMP receptor protein